MADTIQNGSESFSNVPVSIKVCVGTARVSVRELLELKDGSIVPLDKRIEEPVEVFVGETLIAKGELQEVTDDLGTRLAMRVIEVMGESTEV